MLHPRTTWAQERSRPPIKIGVALALVAVVLTACAPDTDVSTTTTLGNATLWGFTPFPADLTEKAVGASFQFVAEEGDLVAHHFDGAIPWSYLLGDGPLPTDLAAELDGRTDFDRAHPELAVYVATALTDLDRIGIPEASAGDERPEGLSDSFADPEVRTALSAWIDMLISRFNPRYLNVAVELDMYAANRPDDWVNLLEFHQETYQRLKAEHPDLVVFASFQAELGDPSVFDSVAEYTDIVGISTYPYLLDDDVPDDGYLARFREPGLPLAIAETGFPSETVASPRGLVAADEGTQSEYVKWLGSQIDRHDIEFVVWFLPYDIDALVGREGIPESAAVFEHIGMVSAEGIERPALAVWRELRE